jgi:hypothetical protein
MDTPDSWRVVCQDPGDGSGDVIVELPSELLEKLGWTLGDGGGWHFPKAQTASSERPLLGRTAGCIRFRPGGGSSGYVMTLASALIVAAEAR